MPARRTPAITRESPAPLVFSRAALREVDARAERDFGLPSILLMENASRHVADVALDGLERVHEPRVLIFAGPGNNGGDGLAIARHLHNAQLRVAVVLAGEPTASDAVVHARAARAMGVPLVLATSGVAPAVNRAGRALGRIDLVIDALFGTGLTRPPTGRAAELIQKIVHLRQAEAPVLSVDIPSGLDADTGEPLGAAVQADVTVSFVGLKKGFLSVAAQPYLGEVLIADIGAPRELVESLGEPLPGAKGPGRGKGARPRRD